MHNYKEVEEDDVGNIGTISKEIREDRLDREGHSDEENPYESVIIHDLKRTLM